EPVELAAKTVKEHASTGPCPPGATARSRKEERMPHELNSAQRQTYDAVCRHPTAHNLHWRDVKSLLGAVAELTEEPNGKLRATRAGRTLLVHPEHHKDSVTMDELVEIRRFLEESEAVPTPRAADGLHVLVVINHREARIYRTEWSGSVPQRIVPH